jgi:putative Ig domain-containing protein/matrixin
MKQFARKPVRSVLLLALLLIPTFHAKATTVVMLSDTELIVNSRAIITGKVASVMSAWDDTHSMVWTYVEVRADRVLKGELSEGTIVLKQIGGDAEASGVRVFGQPGFTPGERVLLYLNTGTDGSLHAAQAFMGKFSVVADGATNGEYVERLADAQDIEILARTAEGEITNRAPFHSYIRKIQQTLRQEAARIAEIDASRAGEPLVAVPAEYSRKKKQNSGFKPDYVFMAGGVRWMEADAGQPISYYVNPNACPVAGGGAAEIARAMAAWPTQSGASIHLQTAGQTGACGIAVDNVNTISFGDCLGQLDPPVGCSGIVALTGINYKIESKVVGGISFNRLLEADTVFNKGMSCFLGNSANLAEVTCHELGHSIGLAHPADPSAIMWGTAHGNGRDATLGADDKAGILAIYPAGAGSGGGSGGGGGGGGTAVSITTAGLNLGITGQKYNATLTATGGTAPYRWSLVGGQLPPGLDMSGSGAISGTPASTGTYAFAVQVSDTSLPVRVDSKWLSVVIQSSGGGSLLPVIAGVKAKGAKKLWVFGQNLSTASLVVVNGLTFTPASIEKDGSTDWVLTKGRLNLGPPGTNVVFVITIFNNSVPFTF